MIEFLGSLLNALMPVVIVALVAGTALLAYVVFGHAGTPRKCAFPGCTTNHWNLEKFCSHHILDEYEEEHGRGARPGDGNGC